MRPILAFVSILFDRKKILAQIILGFIATSYHCQKAFNKGAGYVSIGYGLSYFIDEAIIDKQSGFSYSGYGMSDSEDFSYESKSVGPVTAKCEFGVKKHLGLGLVISYSKINVKETRTYKNTTSQNMALTQFNDVTRLNLQTICFGFRYNIHFFKNRVLDPYAGFAGGYMLILKENSFQSNNPSATPGSSLVDPFFPPLYLALSVGLRYYFKPQLGVYAEVGYDNWALAQVGIALKFE